MTFSPKVTLLKLRFLWMNKPLKARCSSWYRAALKFKATVSKLELFERFSDWWSKIWFFYPFHDLGCQKQSVCFRLSFCYKEPQFFCVNMKIGVMNENEFFKKKLSSDCTSFLSFLSYHNLTVLLLQHVFTCWFDGNFTLGCKD